MANLITIAKGAASWAGVGWIAGDVPGVPGSFYQTPGGQIINGTSGAMVGYAVADNSATSGGSAAELNQAALGHPVPSGSTSMQPVLTRALETTQCQSCKSASGTNATVYDAAKRPLRDVYSANCPQTPCAAAAAPAATCSGIDASIVNTIYQTVLGRAADPSGLATYGCRGYSSASLTLDLTASAEYAGKVGADKAAADAAAAAKKKADEDAKKSSGTDPGAASVPGAASDLSHFVKGNGVLLAAGGGALLLLMTLGGGSKRR